MAATSSHEVPITLTAPPATVGGIVLHARRLWVAMELAQRDGNTLLRDCLLDTGAPLCVIPYSIHHTHQFDWQPLSNPLVPSTAKWHEVDCDIGQIQVWLADLHGAIYGPFSLVAKFPRSTPQALQQRRAFVPILLGLNFFADVQAEVSFHCHRGPDGGTVDFP